MNPTQSKEDIKRMKKEFEEMLDRKKYPEKYKELDKAKGEKEKGSEGQNKGKNETELENEWGEKRDEGKNGSELTAKSTQQPQETHTTLKNSLYDEENEPEFIKNLFNKKIPKNVLDKIIQDQGKFNKIINETEDNGHKNAPKSTDSNNGYTLSSTTNLDTVSLSVSDKHRSVLEDADLFPIKSTLVSNDIPDSPKTKGSSPSPKKTMESQLKGTKDFNDFLKEEPVLKKQYDQLNNYCDFVGKSLNYIINKEAGVEKGESSEAKNIEKANAELNNLILGPLLNKPKEEGGLSLEEWNKKIEEMDKDNSTFSSSHYDKFMKNLPDDEKKDQKLNKFKEHLFSSTQNMSTEDLLEKITKIIKPTNAPNLLKNPPQTISATTQNRQLPPQNRLENFMNNLGNIQEEDQKSENTKEQSESMNNNEISQENLNDDQSRNTINSIDSGVPRKYRHVYRGMVFYNDRPSPRKKGNNKENKGKNKECFRNKSNEVEEDDESNSEEYNN